MPDDNLMFPVATRAPFSVFPELLPLFGLYCPIFGLGAQLVKISQCPKATFFIAAASEANAFAIYMLC